MRRQLREAKTTPPPEPVAKPPVDEAAQIAALLRQCEAHLDAKLADFRQGRLAMPLTAMAKVLRRDRGNAQAQAGLETIAARYADMSRAALQRNDARAARSLIAESLNPDDARLTALREQLWRVENPAGRHATAAARTG